MVLSQSEVLLLSGLLDFYMPGSIKHDHVDICGMCRKVITSRVFDKGLRLSCCTYDAKGQYIGMTNIFVSH